MTGSWRARPVFAASDKRLCYSSVPCRLIGVYEHADSYHALRSQEADDVIGNSILVFDLDRLGQGAPFHWPHRP